MRNFRGIGLGLIGVAALAATLAAAPNARADGTTKVGYLSCQVASGWGFIFGSSRDLVCTFTSAAKDHPLIEHYKGSITKFGADIGYVQSGVILWLVLAPANIVSHKTGLLAGHYGGGTASATVGVGAGAYALVGGMDSSVSLQPVSIEGSTGLNVAAGIAMMDLKYVSTGK